MIILPNTEQAYEFENGFYLTCQPGRVGKLLAHTELYKTVLDVPGAIVECGVFKGASFLRFAALRNLFEAADSRQLIAFDIFGRFPATAFEQDKVPLQKFTAAAGDESISIEQLKQALSAKGCERNVEYVKGDICETAPGYVQSHPELKIALLHLDVDVYEASCAVLESLFPHLAIGGVLVLDDYGIFPGATKAIDDYFAQRPERVRRLTYARAPAYIVREK